MLTSSPLAASSANKEAAAEPPQQCMISLRHLRHSPWKRCLKSGVSCRPAATASSIVRFDARRDTRVLSSHDYCRRHYSHSSLTSMSINFGSTAYASCLNDLPVPDTDALRSGALIYLENFNPNLWYNDPITTILKGQKLDGGSDRPNETVDALGRTNGRQYFATPSEVASLKTHMDTYKSPYTDLREPVRRIEARLLGDYAGFLIGNQCLDFQKQDGVTEMEEATMANAVERRLNDLLIQDEADGKLVISRKIIYVSCVSNFTNFLDVFRKTLRSLELGIPCVVLGRSNTVQHSYRWTELLVDLMRQEGIEDLGMLTYMSCSLDDIKDITRSCRESTGNLYATCSRALAADMMSGYPNTVASTGGPNTMVTTEFNDSIRDAIRMSAAIESSGQCTALRHCVIPESVSTDQVHEIFKSVQDVPDAVTALKGNMFDGVFANHKGSKAPSTDEYTHEGETDTFFKVSSSLPDANEPMEEYWRKVVVDFSPVSSPEELQENDEELYALANWLNANQPISLAVNARYSRMLDLGKRLFETTGLVVYTIGSTNNPEAPPALTCQARPQEGEVFGEFPPRKSLGEYTKYPVVVPSSTPSYDSTYTADYLKSVSLSDAVSKGVEKFIKSVDDKTVRGYCTELVNYLVDATEVNPKHGHGSSRTVLWGLQRPPMVTGLKTCIRADEHTSLDDIGPHVLLFYATNARDQMELSVDPENKDVISICKKREIPMVLQSHDEFLSRSEKCLNSVHVHGPMDNFPMVGNFVSLYLPLGHIKSTMLDDEDFIAAFTSSKKWLRMHDE